MSMPQTQTLTFTLDELVRTTGRLNDIMVEEGEMLKSMRIKELVKFHDEKAHLTGVLERYQHQLASNPQWLKQAADEATREELLYQADDLAFSVEENFRQVSAAKAVNARVVQAIMDVMSDQHRPGTYGRDGAAAPTTDLTLSMNLNQQA